MHKNNANNITSFRDLLQQTDLKYGCIYNGITFSQLEESADQTIVQIFRAMWRTPHLFVTNLRQGIERVNSTPFAFIVERSYAQNFSGKDCNLTYFEDP